MCVNNLPMVATQVYISPSTHSLYTYLADKHITIYWHMQKNYLFILSFPCPIMYCTKLNAECMWKYSYHLTDARFSINVARQVTLPHHMVGKNNYNAYM